MHAERKEENRNPIVVPEEFLCPITQEIMVDPVVAADGSTYERKAIEDWLKGHDTSPTNNLLLPHKYLNPNLVLKNLINDFKKSQAEQQAQQEKQVREIEELQEQQKKQEKDIGELQTKLALQEVSRSALEQEIKTKEEQLKKQVAENKTQQQKITELMSDLSQLKGEVENLKRRDKAHAGSLKELKRGFEQQLEQTKKELADKLSENNAQEQAILGLKSQLQSIQNQLEDSQKQLADKFLERSTQEQEILRLKNELEAKQIQAAQLDDSKRLQGESIDPAEIQYRAGISHMKGEFLQGIPIFYLDAAMCFDTAAQLGHPDARFYIGAFHAIGVGVVQNEERALFFLHQAAEQGHTGAQYFLAKCFYSPEKFTFKGTSAEAVDWLQKIMEQEVSDYQIYVEKYKARPNGEIKNSEEKQQSSAKLAVKNKSKSLIPKPTLSKKNFIKTIVVLGAAWLARQFILPPSNAQTNNLVLNTGDDASSSTLPNNEPVRAIDHGALNRGRAVNTQSLRTDGQTVQGLEMADQVNQLYKLGNLYYEQGKFEESFRFWMQAAEQGHLEACYHVGDAYRRGEGVARNEEMSIKWWKKAAEPKNGVVEAQYSLGLLYGGRGIVEYRSELGVYWFKRAAEQGYALAYANLAVAYTIGEGVEKDPMRAEEYWTKAVNLEPALGKVPAQRMLKERGHDLPTVKTTQKSPDAFFQQASSKVDENSAGKISLTS